MEIGAITGYIDVAQLVLYAFWIFFAGLIYYLHQENKREGYPLVSDRTDRTDRVSVEGFPRVPDPKTYLMRDGHTYVAPPGNPDWTEIAAEPAGAWPGAPLIPTGDPMRDGVGPAAYAMRQDVPDLTAEDEHRIVPLRVAHDFYVEESEPNLIGMEVVAADGIVAGTVAEVWVDRSEPNIRFFETTVDTDEGSRTVLVPYAYCVIRKARRQIKVQSLLAHHFRHVPAIRHPDQVTKLEEDKITAYFAGGQFYATPARQEPLL